MSKNGKMCEKNEDCPIGQYCYTSKRCVDYIDCSEYNREQGQLDARMASQCGPCIKGYTSEHLIDNISSSICKYIKNQAGSDIITRKLIAIILPITITLLIAALLCFYKRQRSRRELNNSNAMVVASAPPEEEKSFIEFDEEKCCIPDNNNKKITESNEFQNSIPYVIQYRSIDAYAPTHSNLNITNNPNNNLLSREVAIIDMPYNRNTEILQSDLPNNDNQSNHNDDDSDTIDSSTEPQDKDNKKKSNLIISQQVTQNITINLNGEEY